MHIRAPGLALVLSLLLLAGCGGGGSDKAQIEDTLTRAFTQDDPELCGELLTDNFVKVFYGGLATCEQHASQGANADSVNVVGVEINGDQATAVVEASGGSASAKPATLRLLKQDGLWRIDGPAN